MDKKTAAAVLDEIGTLLEIMGENPFKTRAYGNAARTLLSMPGDLDDIIRDTGLKGVKGIGEGIRERILELHANGRSAYYEELKAGIPAGLMDMLRIPGMGPKKAKTVYDALGIADIGELEYACHENRLVELPGFGLKTQEKILEGIAFIKKHSGQSLYPAAMSEAEKLIGPILGSGTVIRASIAGSLRRRKETVKDIDVLVSSDDPAAVMELFTTLPDVETVTSRGDTKSSVILKSGIAADLRVVTDVQYPYALHHFTGSKLHNTAMRGRAKDMGLKMNEYGLFRGGEEAPVPCADEAEIFKALGLSFIPPELREDMGEIAAAEKGGLPLLVEEADIRGVLHVHSRYSDGIDEVAELAGAARKMGYGYLGLTDHSPSAAYAGGLKPDDLLRQQAEVDAVNAMYTDIRIFKGAEVDILGDGSLDYAEDVLKGFDFTICSIHSRFNMTEDEATARLVRAVENPYCTILGHPTGRLLLSREGYPVNMKRVIEAAAANGVAIELNAHPLRLDIDWREIMYARRLGVKIAINPDAHNIEGLKVVGYGVGIARKGWLSKDDVLNAMTADELAGWFRSRRK
ncbi:MAG: DNA polymerase/3'-5' exonuclease PolX [Nitrospirae bacterium]|nr:DNA polymerase/3'-5' exonuclease PolX [Nitrospirota bacterium]